MDKRDEKDTRTLEKLRFTLALAIEQGEKEKISRERMFALLEMTDLADLIWVSEAPLTRTVTILVALAGVIIAMVSAGESEKDVECVLKETEKHFRSWYSSARRGINPVGN